ncbi:hypothetical protein E2C01_036823 [Portunus trituberculatus]|uniref:Uncharacterized protein n=1 Tax=Portunus trituberculatus TaxID=210409 RepID=A0A5B7FDH9_PORTR|nr:hypothetical protein [Portunus trituberculatus]
MKTHHGIEGVKCAITPAYHHRLASHSFPNPSLTHSLTHSLSQPSRRRHSILCKFVQSLSCVRQGGAVMLLPSQEHSRGCVMDPGHDEEEEEVEKEKDK